MIDELRERNLIAVAQTNAGLIGYRFIGELASAFKELDDILVEGMSRFWTFEPHSCTALIERDALDCIGFFQTLPSVPLTAVPHGRDAVDAGDWILSPSTCYHTFLNLSGSRSSWELRSFTASGICHRYEPRKKDPTRLASFTMREFVFVGNKDVVEDSCNAALARSVDFLLNLGVQSDIEVATDVFYGESASVCARQPKIDPLRRVMPSQN